MTPSGYVGILGAVWLMPTYLPGIGRRFGYDLQGLRIRANSDGLQCWPSLMPQLASDPCQLSPWECDFRRASYLRAPRLPRRGPAERRCIVPFLLTLYEEGYAAALITGRWKRRWTTKPVG